MPADDWSDRRHNALKDRAFRVLVGIVRLQERATVQEESLG